jgi:hypothetical protein
LLDQNQDQNPLGLHLASYSSGYRSSQVLRRQKDLQRR